MPQGFATEDVALIANGTLRVNDRAEVVRASGGPAPVFNRGYTEIGADARVGTVLTTGNVFLRERALITGDLISPWVPLQQNGVTVLGTTQTGAWVTEQWYPINWNPTYPDLSAEQDITIFQNHSQWPNPGSYRNVTVYSGGQLWLDPGEYHFRDFVIEPGGTVRIATEEGTVEVTVQGNFTHRGTIWDAAFQSGRSGLVVNCTGSNWFHVESEFSGTIVAPLGSLVLASRVHRGQFIARDIEVHQQARIVLAPARPEPRDARRR
ncbi:MAG: hypothetical protein JW751_04135 [Polyangiaceae bacterium]|nr:hypothetical protein [Polyangiaceae bacterium]